MWHLNIPAKIRIFAWRVCMNALPTMHCLRTRGVSTYGICPVCDLCPESTPHALIQCDTPKEPGLFGTTRIRWYMSQSHHFPSKYGKLLGELSRIAKVPLSTAFQLKSNLALCWTAPPPGTHKYDDEISNEEISDEEPEKPTLKK